MLAATMTRVMRYATRRLSIAPARTLKEINDEAAQHKIVSLIEGLPGGTVSIPIRDLHALVGTNQPRILRAVRQLEKDGVVSVEDVIHDPLGSRVSLTER